MSDSYPRRALVSVSDKSGLDDFVKGFRPFLFGLLPNLESNVFGHAHKFFRDCYGFDFMEGTHIIQKHNLVNALKRKNYAAPWRD